MPRFSSLSAPIRRSLLERSDNPFESFDPFQSLDEERRKRRPVSLPLTAPVGPPNLPKTRNRADDVGRVKGALNSAGILGGARRRPVFDTRLETGVRDFQRRKGLRVDGLLNPGGPTIKALGRVLARPPLKGLSGAAVSANTRLVRHLMTTTADGMVPGLMAGDFGTDEAGRAKTADFLSQLFRRDPARAKSLRAKARVMMAADDKGLLDKLILQARLAEEEDDPTPDDPIPDDPGQDDPDGPEDPPYDPGHPQPGDPDDPEPEDPEEPDEPEKPKPDKEKCRGLEVEIANAEATVDDREAQVRDTEQELAALRRELESLEAENSKLDIGSAVTGIVGLIPALRLPGAAAGAVMSGKAAVNEKRIEALKEKIREFEVRLDHFKQDLETLKAELADLKAKLAECKKSSE